LDELVIPTRRSDRGGRRRAKTKKTNIARTGRRLSVTTEGGRTDSSRSAKKKKKKGRHPKRGRQTALLPSRLKNGTQ